MSVKEFYDEIAKCNRCGFCQVACPVFRATGHEVGVARGRLSLLRFLIEGHMDWSSDLEGPLYACLLCGACTANCFPAVATSDLIVSARQEYLNNVGQKKAYKLLFEQLLTSPTRMRKAAKLLAYSKSGKLPKVAQALGLLKIFGSRLQHGWELMGRIPEESLREKYNPGQIQARGIGPSTAYFLGCGMDNILPEAAQASINLLSSVSGQLVLLDNICCGLPAWSFGDLQAARRIAQINLELIDTEVDRIVTDCSSCTAFLKRYPALFANDRLLQEKAEVLATKVYDFAEVLQPEQMQLHKEQDITVTYHDPCHASRGLKIKDKPRNILKSLTGVVYREMNEADWCCGGSGSYAILQHELSKKVLERKMDNVKQSGAEILLTSCPACVIQLSYGARQYGADVEVMHIIEFLQSRNKIPENT